MKMLAMCLKKGKQRIFLNSISLLYRENFREKTVKFSHEFQSLYITEFEILGSQK